MYRVVHHPIYSGVLLLAAGMAATAGSLLVTAAFAFLVGVLSAKARFEERLLAERFPDTFVPANGASRTRRQPAEFHITWLRP